MTFFDELTSDVSDIFTAAWNTHDGRVVPEADNIGLGNNAVELEGTVLYADLAESTALVTDKTPEFAAEIYKTYLRCAAKVIRRNGGTVTAYDGDRIMAVYMGDSKNTSAAKSALQISYCVTEIINPAIKKQYRSEKYTVRQAVGIDTSELFVARTGIRGSNDLVWVGRAANYAAKLCALRQENYTSWITSDVYDKLADTAKLGGTEKKNMWERKVWTKYNIAVYRSSWHWKP